MRRLFVCYLFALKTARREQQSSWRHCRRALSFDTGVNARPDAEFAAGVYACATGPCCAAVRLRSTLNPNHGRNEVPSTLPRKAATSQTQPCRLRRYDAAEVCADVATVSEPRAIAEQQAANHGGDQRSPRHFPARVKFTGETRREQRAEHDAEVHHRGDIRKHTFGQRLGALRRMPVSPRGNVDADAGEDLRPQSAKADVMPHGRPAR